MIQNSRIARVLFPSTPAALFSLILTVSFVVTGGWVSIAAAQIVNSAAFETRTRSNQSADHSILTHRNSVAQDVAQDVAQNAAQNAAQEAANANNAIVNSTRKSTSVADADLNPRVQFNSQTRPQWTASPAQGETASTAAASDFDSPPATFLPVKDVSNSNVNYDAPQPPEPKTNPAGFQTSRISPTPSEPFSNVRSARSTPSARKSHAGSPTPVDIPSEPPSASIQQAQLMRSRDANRARNLQTPPRRDTATQPVANQAMVDSQSPSQAPPQAAFSSPARTLATDQQQFRPQQESHANKTAHIDDSFDRVAGDQPGRFESAYLHDRQTNASTATPPPSEPHQHSILQTAFTSPLSPAEPQQSQNSNANNGDLSQNSRRSFQSETNRSSSNFDQSSPRAQQPSQRQRTLPQRHNTHAKRQFTDNQNSYRGQTESKSNSPQSTLASEKSPDASDAKTIVGEFNFEKHASLADGLPIRLIDVLRTSRSGTSRAQLIPQYWEVYLQWAQSIIAANHQNWVASLSATQQTDNASVEIAQSNAQNEVAFSAIQLGKSQAKMKTLMASTDPIIPIDWPTVTRVRTNYQAFKSRGLISSRFDGIDQTLQKMHGLIAARAKTVRLAQQNADQAKQLYQRNQSTIDHVLSAEQTWRSAESDFIASVVEYNKAYADYALALPYGRGPAETVIGMLIVEPPTTANTSNASASNGSTRSDAVSTNSNEVATDLAIPYRSSQPNSSRSNNTQASSATNRSSQLRNNNPLQPVPATNSSQDSRPGFGNSRVADQRQFSLPSQTSAGRNVTTSSPPNRRSEMPAGNNRTDDTDGFALTRPKNEGTRMVQRPSQFPTGNGKSGSNSGNPTNASNQAFSPFAAASNKTDHSLTFKSPGQSSSTQSSKRPNGNRTARGSQNPFSSIGSSTSGSSSSGSSSSGSSSSGSSSSESSTTSRPSTQPPANSGFSFGS